MRKRWSKSIVLVLSLLLLAGLVTSVSAANGADNSQGNALCQGIRAGRQHAQNALKAVADLTGLNIADIRSQRAEGKSLAAIAESKDVSEQEVIDKVVAERTAALNQLKADNKITEAQYENCLNNMQERIKANIERTTVGGNGRQMKNGTGRQGAGQGQGMGGACGQNAANCACTAPAVSQ